MYGTLQWLKQVLQKICRKNSIGTIQKSLDLTLKKMEGNTFTKLAGRVSTLYNLTTLEYKRLPRNVSQQQALSDNNNEPIIDHTYANCQKVDNDKTAQSEEGGMAKEMIRKALELIANKDKVNKRVIARVTATVNSLLGLPVDLSKTVDIGIRLFCEGKEVKPVDGNVFNIKTKDPFAKVKVEIKNKNIEEIEVKSWVDDDEPGFATIEAEETLEVEVEAPVNEFFVMSCHDAPPKIDGKYEIVGIQINFEE